MTMIYPHWVFDDTPIDDPDGRGERAARFFRALRHPKSRAPSAHLSLRRFGSGSFGASMGHPTTSGNRLVRTVYIQIPRGARKTTIGAGLGLLHSFGHEKNAGRRLHPLCRFRRSSATRI